MLNKRKYKKKKKNKKIFIKFCYKINFIYIYNRMAVIASTDGLSVFCSYVWFNPSILF